MFKTNDTRSRVNYGNILLPPEGYTLNFAVGTTYSLDLEALTAVCLSLGLAEDTDSALLQNPVSMLNALQKVSEKVLIFCEAGQIKMPGAPSALSLMLEKMIVPVALTLLKRRLLWNWLLTSTMQRKRTIILIGRMYCCTAKMVASRLCLMSICT